MASVATKGLGHIYVARFSGGTIKVGLSKRPQKRLGQHADAASRQGASLGSTWVSPAHVSFVANEQALIDFCTETYGPPVYGKETFAGAEFDAVVAFAESLTFPTAATPSLSPIARVPLEDRDIYTVLIDGKPKVVLRPTLASIGIDFSAQFKKMRTRSWALGAMGQCTTVAADGKARSMVTISLDGWSMLLANIDENRVKPEIAPLLAAYQRRSASALCDYWTPRFALVALPQQLALTDKEVSA